MWGGGIKALVVPKYLRGTCREGMYDHTYSKGIDQPGKVANPVRGQLNSR